MSLFVVDKCFKYILACLMHQCPCATAGVYRQRHPERSVFYRVLFHYFESFLLGYEPRFEREYGYFRPIIQEVVDRYLDCGNPPVNLLATGGTLMGGRSLILL